MIIRDSTATCTEETTEICQPCVEDFSPHLTTMITVGIICATIIIIAILVYKYKKLKLLENSAEVKRNQDSEERKLKQETDLRSLKSKRKEELQNRMLNYIESRITEGETITKDDKYLAKLKELINEKPSQEQENEERA